MSNTVGNNLLRQSLLSPTVLEHQSRINSSTCVRGNTFFQPQANSLIHKCPISTEFHGNRLTIQKNKLQMGKQRAVSRSIRAVLAANPSSVLTEKFNLGENIELQVDVEPPTSGYAVVNIQVTSSSDRLLLHWGAIKSQKGHWVLPHHRPVGTMVYKNKALRSPFVKSGSHAVLTIEIDDPAIQALEFLVFDEAGNKWYKYNGGNFYVELPKTESKTSNVSVPEDLVQIQAYLRWERQGKQNYTPQKEKEEYEAARMELLEEIARGTSIKDLRTKLTSKPDASERTEHRVSETKSNIPDDLVQIQSYVRWEKAGKPNYSREQQLKEFEEARKELQVELEKGASLDEIRKKITKGEIKTKVSKQLAKKSYFTTERIQRKGRDLMSLLTKFASVPIEEKISSEPEVLSAIQQLSRVKEDQYGPTMSKKIYKLADKELLGEGFMVGVQINPVSGLPSGFPGLLEAREELRPLLSQSNDRLRDLIFLDIALDSAVRTAVERGYEELSNACPEGWNLAQSLLKSRDDHWALFAKSVLDRTRLSLASKAESYHQLLQPSAEYLGARLGVDQWAVNIFTEEMIRAGSAASLSSLLNRLDPVLRQTAHLGSWQVISPVEAIGYVVVVDQLLSVQNKSYSKPTILVAKSVKGEEEIPDGAVAVLTPDMPDVLSHVSVRARNSKVCFATCFDANILGNIQAYEGKLLRLKPTSADVVYSEMKDDALVSSNNSKGVSSVPAVTLVRKQFAGKYAISSQEFTSDMVGAKSRNIAHLKGKVPSWVNIPTSVALPFGVFETVLSDNLNKDVAKRLEVLKKKLEEGNFSALGEIRSTVSELSAPPQLVKELKEKMQNSGMPWPGDEGAQRWEQAWTAIKKVVKGLGETLVGAYPGRALSFICKKNDLNSPQVLGYPSKPIGLFIRRSIIFRSDSNGEDLEGYAGAGLYDSVPMDEEEQVVLDYSSDALIIDGNFRHSILSSIARAGSAIEELYGSAQDIEGVVKDGKIYVVQTRPQM
ncbi:UNVERIFIED_CONTAM: Alpha-glucan water dikinase, chloroplastic [Sesamum latifolium]|uniref:Alpha-glucan water dikinase, chloroplastic n=1 Tax=Sesamum latifolium TaxID=2727402 RepID=A0AAW2UVA8_9LAMI